MDLRFDAYESRVQEIFRKYLHMRIQVHTWPRWPSQVTDVLESECYPRKSNSVFFVPIVPKQQKRVHVSIV
jgi:hypothetical protein